VTKSDWHHRLLFRPQTQLLFVDAFLQNNRLDHVTQVMGFHPTYLDVFLRTQNFILRGDGPLPYDYRHLIAIMVSGHSLCRIDFQPVHAGAID
jgi:sestrin